MIGNKRDIQINFPGLTLLVIFLFMLTFCGTPSLHEVVVKHIQECK